MGEASKENPAEVRVQLTERIWSVLDVRREKIRLLSCCQLGNADNGLICIYYRSEGGDEGVEESHVALFEGLLDESHQLKTLVMASHHANKRITTSGS